MTISKFTTAPSVRPWRRGEPLTARRLNEPLRRINETVGPLLPSDAEGAGKRTDILRRMIVVSVKGDFVLCKSSLNNTPSAPEIPVAKPFLLRRSIVSRDGVTFTFTNDQERTATKSPDTETQVVVPRYVVNDEIFATTGIAGGTGVVDDSGKKVILLDLNLDGRAWAKKAT